MAQAYRILVVDDSPLITRILQDQLSQAGYQVRTATDGLQALITAAEWKPDGVILDIMMPGIDGFECCRRLRREPGTQHTPIILLTAQASLAEKVQGFEAGADDYMTKPFAPEELRMRLSVLLKRSIVAPALAAEAQVRGAEIFAFYHLRGGVGTTSLAVNLAVSLAQLWGDPVVLLDLALTSGHAALMLDVPAKNTWGDLARVPENELDKDVVEGHLTGHVSGVRVLPAPLTPEDGELVTGKLVSTVLGYLRERYNYIVADTGADFREATLTMLDNANYLYLPVVADLASLRSASVALNVFSSLGYDKDKVRLLLSPVGQNKRSLTRDEMETAIKQPLYGVVPHDPEVFTYAINRGVPVVMGTQQSPVLTMFEDMAWELSRQDQREATPTRQTEMYQRVSKRKGPGPTVVKKEERRGGLFAGLRSRTK
jgi:pilus assembly protein CpaE